MSFGATKLLAASGGEDYEIDQSLVFDSGDSADLTKTMGSGGSRKTYTISMWLKRTKLGARQAFIYGGSDNENYTTYADFSANDELDFVFYSTTSGVLGRLKTNRLFRDVASWYHVVLAVDTTESTAGNRFRMYINGVEETSFSVDTNPPLDSSTHFLNDGFAHYIGNDDVDGYFNGYIAEVNVIDGSQLTPSSFGKTNAVTNAWIPKKYGGAYGTQGFYLKFVSGALGTDSSGQGNNWTANNLADSDVLLDTPTNNFSTLNSLMGNAASGITLTQGNLKAAQASLTSDTAKTYSTIGLISGKWYVEVACSAANVYSGNGVVNASQSSEGFDFSSSTNNVSVFSWGDRVYKNGSQTQSGVANAASGSNILGIALNLDDGTVQLYSNGSTTGSAETLTRNTGDIFVFCNAAESGGYASTSAYEWNFGQNGTHSGTKTAGGNTDGNGIGNFVNAVPSGFLAPCTSNLADPAIKLPGSHFNPVIYTGNDTTNNITGVGFQPDLVWLKNRSQAADHMLHDAVRGSDYGIRSNTNVAESDQSANFTGFASDGFNLASSSNRYNDNSENYVSWNWKANGSGSANTDGSINSTVSANTTAGFSIVTFTGTSGTGTIGHALSQAPETIWHKNRDATASWTIYHAGVASDPATDYLQFNSTNAASDNSTVWNDTAPTSSVFSVGQGSMTSGDDSVAYCFHSVEGFSKFGSYFGNGSTSGPYIYTGFRPAFIMLKKSSSSGSSWFMWDNKREPTNVAGVNTMWADATNGDTYDSSYLVDFLSTGFKLRGTNTGSNASGEKIVFFAFAESPFKYANAR